jgi:hypothetical protein
MSERWWGSSGIRRQQRDAGRVDKAGSHGVGNPAPVEDEREVVGK